MALTDRLRKTAPPPVALKVLLGTRARLRAARDAMLPAQAALIDRSLAVAEVRALGIAAELDLAGLISQRSRRAEDLAQVCAVDPDGLERLLRLLAATGCFRVDRAGYWHHTRLSEPLRADHPDSVREWMRFFGGGDLFRIWAAADQAVATGASATESVTGASFFEWAHSVEPHVGERFDAAMQAASTAVGRSFVETVELDGVNIVCDVGGGTGALVEQILERHDEMRGIVFDLPEVIGHARPPDAVAGRLELVDGSFFESVPEADCYVLVSIVHDWDDDRAVEILECCRASLAKAGRILVVEATLDPSRAPFIERHTDPMMLVLTGAGRERTREDFDALFGRARLEVRRTWTLATLQTVYELGTSPL